MTFAFLLITNIAFAGTATDPSLTALGARSLGMGGITATLFDSNSVFANPAGLDYIRDWQLSGTSNTILNDINQNIVSGAYKTPWGTLGLGYVDLSMSGSYATMRDPSNFGRIIVNPSVEAIGYENSVIVLSYARKFSWLGSLSLGVNFKSYNQTISGSSETASRGSSTNLDLGVLYTPSAMPWLTTGAVYKNALSSNLQWSGASTARDSIGGVTTIGFSGNILGNNSLWQYGDQNLIAAIDFELPRGVLSSSNSSLMHMGTEWKPVKEVTLRAGLDQRNSSTNLNYGIGLERGGFRFDYAYKGSSVSEAVSHVFTLSYAPEPEKPKLLIAKGPYVLEILSPADKSSTTAEVLAIKGRVRNAVTIAGIKINGKFASPLITTNSFEVYWYPLKNEANVLLIDAFIASPEAGAARTQINVLRASPIIDIKSDYFAKDPINYLQKLSIMKGYYDGSFKPNNPITRAELVTLLVKARGITAEAVKDIKVKDLPKTFWATKYAAIAIKENIVSGYPDKTFKPLKNVTRAEGAVILSRFAGLSYATPEYSPYSDVPTTNWAATNIISAKKAGLLSFVPYYGSFEANKRITRGEIAFMLSKTKTISDAINTFFGRVSTFEIMSITPEAAIKAAPILKTSVSTLESLSVTKEAAPVNELFDIMFPPANTETTYNAIIVTGNVLTAEAKYILVNAQKIDLAPKSRSFSKTINLLPGENIIEITAINKDAKIIGTLKEIVRKKVDTLPSMPLSPSIIHTPEASSIKPSVLPVSPIKAPSSLPVISTSEGSTLKPFIQPLPSGAGFIKPAPSPFTLPSSPSLLPKKD